MGYLEAIVGSLFIGCITDIRAIIAQEESA